VRERASSEQPPKINWPSHTPQYTTLHSKLDQKGQVGGRGDETIGLDFN